MDHYAADEIAAQFAEADEVVVHSLRAAARYFDVASADTIAQWCRSGRLAGEQAPGPNGRWTIRIPKDHPRLIGNQEEAVPRHYPRLEDAQQLRLAALEAENARLADEVGFLREQLRGYQQQLPDLLGRLLTAAQPALPPPRPWWRALWPWASGPS